MPFKNHIFRFLVILFLLPSGILAQKSEIYEHPDLAYQQGLDLFTKEKFGSAQAYFTKAIESYGLQFCENKTDAEYFNAICAIELFHGDAEYLIGKFIAEHPESKRVKTAYFQMGRYQYRQKKYGKAIDWFEKVDRYNLTSEQLAEYYFKTGYSYYVNDNLNEAGKAFFEIKDVDTKYTVPAIYYHAHIEYLLKNYAVALDGFRRLVNNEQFGPIVPYYITQILFYQKKYNELIEYAPPLLDSASTKRAPEIARVIGESYFRTQRFSEAIPYLELFMDGSSIITREDYYKIAFCYYMNGIYDKAAKKFSSIANASDALAQHSYLLLADCYLKMGNKQKAQYAFMTASDLEADNDIREEALYNYAVLTYELTISPFNEAIKAFEKYLELYPNSDKIPDVNTYLVKVFSTTRNYRSALRSLEKIPVISPELELVYQRISYYRGLELYLDGQYNDAIELFNKSLVSGKLDVSLKAQALYWMAEAYYTKGTYTKAIESYNEFILSDGAFELTEYKTAHYNLAYSNFKLKDYQKAITWFRMYERLCGEAKSTQLADTYIRTGDCYFMERKYPEAVIYYDKAISANVSDGDYALYQKGISCGLLSNHNQKIMVLNKLLSDYSKSSYRPSALYELASSYKFIDSPEMALSTYQMIIDESPGSNFVKKAYMEKGLLFYNMENYQDALVSYGKVVSDFKGNPEVNYAIDRIKQIYTDMNNIDEFESYANQLVGYSISAEEMDSISYSIAEKLYMQNNCEQAASHFQKYIERYKSGRYLIHAHFYKAECNLLLADSASALLSYNYVSEQSKTKFSEQALYKAAKLSFMKQDYYSALQDYEKLIQIADRNNISMEAAIGVMRCNFQLKKFPETITSAISVLKIDKLPEKIAREAHYKIATSYLATNQQELALEEFQLLSNNVETREGAEAKYRLSELYMKFGQDSLAEAEVMDFVRKSTPFPYWVAKSVIISSEIYIKREEYFQAKAMLYSVISNYEDKKDEIIGEAEELLEDIKETEEAKEIFKQSYDFEIPFEDNSNGIYDDLFKEIDLIFDGQSPVDSTTNTDGSVVPIEDEKIIPSDDEIKNDER